MDLPSQQIDKKLTSINDVNAHLICTVCRGYLVDATTITECLHSFCRSCVVPHVTEFNQCPSCSVPLSSTKPFSQLRRDYTLQSIVYKMVPRLARNELERRKKFHQDSTDNNKTDERYLQSFYAPNDPISMSLEYADLNCQFGLRAKLDTKPESSAIGECNRRYFKCPANLPIGHLVKFLRCKFDVLDPTTHKLEILYNGRPLSPEYKLSDVAYIFSWKEREPLRLWYRILPCAKEEETIQVKTKGNNNQRESLVDITSKRIWQCNGKDERKQCKRRKQNKTIFDDTRTDEFSCSTPIPSTENGESNKIQNWLPKAVFDLDDRALFAKRLQRITELQPETKQVVPAEAVKTELPTNEELIGPLRICVTPPAADCEIHDSIGALDLSGSKGDSLTDVSSPLSAGSCRSSASPGASSKVGPHPYFMTPSAVYHHVQQQDPAQSMAALATVSSRRSEGDEPIWDLFHRPSSANSLLSLLKSNSLLFRTTPNNKKKMSPNSA